MQLTASGAAGDMRRMSDTEAVNRRAELRAEEARQRAEELQGRYRELAAQSEVNHQELQHARRAAIAAKCNAAEANQHLLEQLERSAAIHQLAAEAHDQAAAYAPGYVDKLGHSHAAERHRGAARRDRTLAAQLRESVSATAADR